MSGRCDTDLTDFMETKYYLYSSYTRETDKKYKKNRIIMSINHMMGWEKISMTFSGVYPFLTSMIVLIRKSQWRYYSAYCANDFLKRFNKLFH